MTEHRDIIDVRLPEKLRVDFGSTGRYSDAPRVPLILWLIRVIGWTMLFGSLAVLAFAQTAAVVAPEPSALSVALSNALIALLAIVVPVVGTFLTLALNRLRAKWGLEATAQDRSNLDTELKAAAAVGIAKVAPIDPLTPVTHAEAVSHAAEYFVKRFPERTATIVAATGAFTADETKDAVAEMIAGRLPDVVAAPSAPVVVVPGASVKP